MKIPLLFLLLFSCAGCLNIANVYRIQDYNESKDEFKNVERLSFEEGLIALERRPSVRNVQNFYLKETAPNGQTKVTLHVILIKNQLDFFTENEFYIATDAQIFKIKIENKEIEHYSTISESTSNILRADSTTVSVIDSYSQNNYVQSRFSVELTQEQLNAILQTNKLSYRYYGGGKTSTFTLPEGNLKRVKQVIR